MPNPKRQHSKQRGAKRRTHFKLKTSLTNISTEGFTQGYNHRIDPITGCYKGKQIITPKVKKEKAKS